MTALDRIRTAFVTALDEVSPAELLACLDDCRDRVDLLVTRRASEAPQAPETQRSGDCDVWCAD